MEAFSSKPLQTTQSIGMQNILPPAGEEGHSSNENAYFQT